MSLQTSITNRRQFLERSALGAGSVLFFPGLLISCTDHQIPGPGYTPILGDDDNDDWSDATKTVVVTALEAIPEVGEILGALAEILWPQSGRSVWDQVKDRVEQLIDQKIDDQVYKNAKRDLDGLKGSIDLYLQYLHEGNLKDTNTQWMNTVNSCVGVLSQFKTWSKQSGVKPTPQDVMLLPLFAQLANLYLPLLRDGVVYGENWGRNDAEQQGDIANLKKAITDYTSYANDTYNDYLSTLNSTTPVDSEKCEPFLTVNKYDREMTSTVLDYVPTWAYYDVTLYPNGWKITLPREIYSDPYGTCHESGNIALPKQQPTQGPNQIVISRVADSPIFRSVQVTYPAGTGPGGVTTTPEMGTQKYVLDRQYTNRVIPISPTNPITRARVYIRFTQVTEPPGLGGRTYTLIQGVEAMMFMFKDNTPTELIGGLVKPYGDQDFDSDWLSYPNHMLSSIWINGSLLVDEGPFSDYNTSDSVVFGFRYLNGRPPVTTKALRALYIASPKERSAADFAQVYSAYGITQALITDELKAARQAHWASVKARADALK